MLIDFIHILMMLWIIFGTFTVSPNNYPTVLFSYVLVMCHWGEGIYKPQQHYCYLSELASNHKNTGSDIPDSFMKRVFGSNIDFWIMTEMGYWVLLGQIIFLFWKIHPQVFEPWLNRFFMVLFLGLYLQNCLQ